MYGIEQYGCMVLNDMDVCFCTEVPVGDIHLRDCLMSFVWHASIRYKFYLPFPKYNQGSSRLLYHLVPYLSVIPRLFSFKLQTSLRRILTATPRPLRYVGATSYCNIEP